jgi:long-chain acyl-CoA synthetase
LSREIAEFFHGAGIVIAEGYGLTESSAASFVNRPEDFRFGTVGPPLPGVEVQIAADGEVLIRGRGVMRGYYNLPEATADALDADGWLMTGDIGVLDDGYLKLTDRKKDLIKTSGGKYVAPQELEGKLKARSTLLSQVLVHGNNRNFVSALVTLSPEGAPAWARASGLEVSDYASLVAHPRVRAELESVVESLNKELPSHSTIKKFAILPRDLTQEEGELTPSLKVKRKSVETRYKAVLDGFYSGALA